MSTVLELKVSLDWEVGDGAFALDVGSSDVFLLVAEVGRFGVSLGPVVALVLGGGGAEVGDEGGGFDGVGPGDCDDG